MLPLIHTPHIQNNQLAPIDDLVYSPRNFVGPAILIPRVGEPSLKKICIARIERPSVLSDCIFAIEGDENVLDDLYRKMHLNWRVVRSAYSGACARYLTKSSLEKVIGTLLKNAQGT